MPKLTNPRKRVKLDLEVKLTDQERIEYGKKLAEVEERLGAAEIRKAEISAQLGADVKAARAEASRVARVLRHGFEIRPVECDEITDEAAGTVSVVRLDTGEVVSTRPLPAQTRLLT